MYTTEGRATRTTAILAIFLAFVMLGVPSIYLGNHGLDLGAVENASAAGISSRTYTMGWIDFLGDIGTLNPFVYTMTAEYIVIWSVYDTLLVSDYTQTDKYVGGLASNWTLLPDGLTWKFDIAPNAYWCDPLTPNDKSHPINWKDVQYTFWECQNGSLNVFSSYFPDVLEAIYPDPVNPQTFYVKLKFTYAPFESALSGLPILPEYYWSTKSNVYSFNGCRMIGSGPFYYNSSKLPTTECRLQRNPIWYQEVNRGWQVHYGTFVIRNEADATTAKIELDAGIIDTMTTVPPSIYKQEIMNNPAYVGFGVDEGFVYEFNANQMSDALRTEMHMSGSSNQLLRDPVVVEAMNLCINREAFSSEVLLDLGVPADSLVPRLNKWHYTYGLQPSEGGRAPVGEEPWEFRPDIARQILNAAGWNYDTNGQPATLTTVPLCKAGGIDPLSFKMYSILPEPEWKLGTEMITENMSKAGILLHGKLRDSDPPDYFSVNVMNGYWKTANYDCWLWDWYMSNVGDPCVDVMSVLTSMEIPTYNSDVYWSNATYDSVYNQSIRAADPVSRMVFTDELQRMAYKYSGCIPVAYRQELYASTETHWENYGDWEARWMLTVDTAAPFLPCRLDPIDNNAPHASFASESYEMENLSTAIPLVAYANDDGMAGVTGLQVKFFWGDYTSTDWVAYDPGTGSGGTQAHAYAKDGVYRAYVAFREVGTADGFSGWNWTTVTVKDMRNQAPINFADIWVNPVDPDTGTNVTITSNATDPEGDPLYFTWDFGDLNSSIGKTVYHQWTETDSYSLKLSVTDAHVGQGSRPKTASTLVPVADNSPPTLSLDSRTGIQAKTDNQYFAGGNDTNTRDQLQYTWNWGDGTISVTTTNNTFHRYDRAKLYTLAVSLDDRTGLPLHNVTKTAQIEVYLAGNNAPAIASFTVSKSNPYTGEIVTFTGSASDQNKDIMDFTFDFGDGELAFVPNVGGGDTKDHSASVTHSYATAGSKTAYLFVSDGQANSTSSGVPLTIVANSAPIVNPLEDVSSSTGVATELVASAFDPEMDTMAYWWDFGDGTPVVSGGTGDTSVVQHTYATSGGCVFTVYVNDGITGHNSSQSASIQTNWIPWIVNPLPDLDAYNAEVTFSVTAWDNDTFPPYHDNTSLQFTWTFGDGSGTVIWGSGSDPNPIVTHTYAEGGVYTYSVWVFDQIEVTTGGSHNVTKSATVTVVLEFTLNLYTGWNFVSVPRVGYGYMASSLDLGPYDVIEGWNPGLQDYDQGYIVGLSPPEFDFPISESTGYWVYANAPRTLTLHGQIPTTTQSRTITVPSGGGWVIIGFNSLSTTMMASDVLTMFTGGGIDTVEAWDPVLQDYIGYIPAIPETDFALGPGQAYWIYVTASGTLSYSP